MKVYKFGGASLADSKGFVRVGEILKKETEPVFLIVSALGKTTNALEKVCYNYFNKSPLLEDSFNLVKNTHYDLTKELLPENNPVFGELDNAFLEIEWVIEEEPHTGYDFIYDQIVSIGEILSSKILNAFLLSLGIDNGWIDCRGLIQTDNQYRQANILWDITQKRIETDLKPLLKNKMQIGQGFIGGTSENYTTTLGREGSDYSAAIFAKFLDSSSLTVWKDVPGIMNADPKLNPEAIFIPELSYHEVAELSYYGASILHPKTIQPLLEKEIPLWVKSFFHPENAGTKVSSAKVISAIPSYIVKTHQMLLTLYSLDGGFILEKHLTKIYSFFAEHGISLNLALNSALSFSVLIDQIRYHEQIPNLILQLSEHWKVKFNQDLNLLTIRHDAQSLLDYEKYLQGHEILIEVSTRHTLQKVSRSINHD